MKTNKMRILLFSSIVAAVLSLSLVAGNLQFVYLLIPSNAASQSQPTLPSQSASSTSSVSSLPDVFQKVENSVVQITSTKSNPNQIIILNGVPQSGRSTALGSGFVYDNQGHIVTNNHVVGGASRADVTFTDGNTYSANVVGRDRYSDLVILQITGNYSEEKGVVPLPLANSSAVRPGDQVIAIGNPFGLSGTITTGIVSAKGRLLPDPDTGFSIPEMIQTDAAVNPGNSGGPLLNAQGQVIGLNTAIFSRTGSYSGVGFAIPSNTIAKEVPLLIKNGSYTHPWIGISGGKMTPDIIRAMGLPANYKGVLVASVQPNSPADMAGLRGLPQGDSVRLTRGDSGNAPPSQLGDIITVVDGHAVRQIDDIINYIESQKNVGDNIKFTVNRNGQIMDLTATLQARPQTSLASSSSQDQNQPPDFGRLLPRLPDIPGFPKFRLPPLLP